MLGTYGDFLVRASVFLGPELVHLGRCVAGCPRHCALSHVCGAAVSGRCLLRAPSGCSGGIWCSCGMAGCWGTRGCWKSRDCWKLLWFLSFFFFFFPTMEGAWENRCDFIATSLLFVLPEAGGLAGSKVYAEHRESSAQKTWSVVLAMLLSLCGAPGWTSGRERGA